MQLVLWLRVLAAEVQADLAGLLPPLLPCYNHWFSISLGSSFWHICCWCFLCGYVWWVFCWFVYCKACLASCYGVFYSSCSSLLPVMMCFFKTALEDLLPWPVFHGLPSHRSELLSVVDSTEGINGNREPQLVRGCRQTVNGNSLKPQGKRWEHYLKARVMQFSSLVHISDFVLTIDL